VEDHWADLPAVAQGRRKVESDPDPIFSQKIVMRIPMNPCRSVLQIHGILGHELSLYAIE
jgi:hypothetical protein